MSADTDGWSVRIGDEAAGLIGRATAARRAGGVSGVLFVVLEIAFQLADYYRPGIEASVIFLVAFVFGWFYAIRLMARARRVVAARVGLPTQDAKWVRLRHGTEGFDRWIAARDRPGWPSSGWR